MKSAVEVMPATGVVAILTALGLSVATFYRQRKPKKTAARTTPARALSTTERTNVLAVLHEERFRDRAPAEVVATLLDEGRYLASERTMYRLLAAQGESHERRNQLVHPTYAKPELVATAPNQVWSWDITKLLTHQKFVYLYLYVVIDIFSRYVVGWLLADKENAALAARLVDETIAKHDVTPGVLTLHADRGAPMRSKLLSQLLAELDVGKSFNRPHTSNDNPFSESAFKTVKYHPGFPRKFVDVDDGLKHFRSFFPWYNNEHHHSGIAMLTPADVHYRGADAALQRHHDVAMAAYAKHPERFVNGPPRRRELPTAVFINPPPSTTPEPVVATSREQLPPKAERQDPPPLAAPASSTTTPANTDPLRHRELASATAAAASDAEQPSAASATTSTPSTPGAAAAAASGQRSPKVEPQPPPPAAAPASSTNTVALAPAPGDTGAFAH
jgi:putative transposase